MAKITCIAVVLMVVSANCAIAAGRPNILLIVADDLGYSDLGCFGGDIRTPNLDALAARGLRATDFYVSPTCSPTRSMLLTGADNHVAGFGTMAEFIASPQKMPPGYECHLNGRVACVASLLRDAGYHTYLAGKWHLGAAPPYWPARQGFERDFTMLQGAGSNWCDRLCLDKAHPQLTFTRNGKLVGSLPPHHFSSAAYSDFIMRCLQEHAGDGKPFFAYLAFQAVHAPLHVPDEWLDRYRGQYDRGYDVVRGQRLERMKSKGLVSQSVAASPRLPEIKPWDGLSAEERKLSARRMEIYAAMVENMDYHIGRVLRQLQSMHQLDNTLVIFLSDNGAEAGDPRQFVLHSSTEYRKWAEKTYDMRPQSWGKKGSLLGYGQAWAQVGTVPFRLYKGYLTEGGIRAPLIMAGAGVRHRGTVTSALLHVTDVVPTLLDVAVVKYPSSKLAPLYGKSLRPLLAGSSSTVRSDTEWVGWELFGNRAIRRGWWKLLYLMKDAGGSGQWQLFHLSDDVAELHDLSAKYPRKRAELLQLWEKYARDNQVSQRLFGPYTK